MATPPSLEPHSHRAPNNANKQHKTRDSILQINAPLRVIFGRSGPAGGEVFGVSLVLGCAREEGKKVLGIWAYSDDRTNLPGVRTVSWTWSHIEDFIDSL